MSVSERKRICSSRVILFREFCPVNGGSVGLTLVEIEDNTSAVRSKLVIDTRMWACGEWVSHAGSG